MVNYKVNTENLSLDAYKKNAYKKISSVLVLRYKSIWKHAKPSKGGLTWA